MKRYRVEIAYTFCPPASTRQVEEEQLPQTYEPIARCSRSAASKALASFGREYVEECRITTITVKEISHV